MSSLFLLLPLLLVAAGASAQVVTYDRAAEFLAAVEPDILIDFEETEGQRDQNYQGGYEQSGVLVFASDGYMYVRNYDAESNGFLYAANRARQAYVEIDLPPGTTAVGANVTTFYTYAIGTVKVSLSSGRRTRSSSTVSSTTSSTLPVRAKR